METVNDTDPPTDTPPPYRHAERLTRATDDKVVAGVAGGLGRYFGIDPVVFRIAFVVLTLAGGSGVVLYLLAWLVVPDDHGAVPLRRVGRERNQKLVAAVLAGAGVLILLNQLGRRGNGDLPIGLVLVAVGALVLWSRRDGHHPDGASAPPPVAPVPPVPGAAPPSTPPATDPSTTLATDPLFGDTAPLTTPPDPDPDPKATAPMATAPTVAAPPGPPPAPPPAAAVPAPAAVKEPKPRSVLVRVTLSLLAVLAGILILIGVSATTGLAVALLVTGGALVVGAWRGRARWLIPVGLVLAVALAASSLIDVPVRGGSGAVRFRPTTVAQVQSPYRLGAGNMTVDLGGLDLAGSTVTVVASVAAGHVQIMVPRQAAVDIDARVGGGSLQLLGHQDDGLDVRRQISEPGSEDGGRVVLRVRAGFGLVEVRRAVA